MNVLDVVQGTPEWLSARCGMVTASRIKDVLATIKNGEAAARRNYKAEIVSEILTGEPYEQYVNADMQRGTEQEPFSRAAYEVKFDVVVDQVGFVLHPLIPRCGASPDGCVGSDGLVEIKAPKTATHLQYLLDGEVPDLYFPQMMWQMACTGRQWNDFVSYDPRLPEHLQLFVCRLHRSDKVIAEMEQEVIRFNAEVDEILAKLPKE